MKMRVKAKEDIYDLDAITIGNVKYPITAPILIGKLYGKVIDVEISKYPQYTFVGEGWDWHKNWLEEAKQGEV